MKLVLFLNLLNPSPSRPSTPDRYVLKSNNGFVSCACILESKHSHLRLFSGEETMLVPLNNVA